MIDLTGKAALVTGGSRGIGRALLPRAGARGRQVAVNYRVETPSADAGRAEIEEVGRRGVRAGAPTSRDRAEAEMLVDETVARFGRLDILVNNAGIWKGSPIEEMTRRRVGRDDRGEPRPARSTRSAPPCRT